MADNEVDSCSNVDERNKDGFPLLQDYTVLKNQFDKLVEKNAAQEKEFSQKRAMFMDMFRQKEDEVRRLSEVLKHSEDEKKSLQENLKKQSQELDDAKSALTIAEVSQEDELVRLRQRHQEEVSSLQHIMRESLAQLKLSEAERVEQLRAQWAEQHEGMEAELMELRTRLNQEREGFMASIAKTLQKKVAAAGIVPTGTTSTSTEADNLEDSMRKAQEGTEILKSVVLPLEEEINRLRRQLAEAKSQIQALELHSKVSEDVSISHMSHYTSDASASADVSLLGASLVHDDSQLYHDDGEVSTLSRSRSSQSLASITKELVGDEASPRMSPAPGTAAASRSVGGFTSVLGGSRETESPLNEVKGPRDKRSCDMCCNYEAQLQTIQESEKKCQDKLRVLERQMQVQHETFTNQQKYIADLEIALKREAENFQAEISNQQNQVEKIGATLQSTISEFTQTQEGLNNKLKSLTDKRAEVDKELHRLQDENNDLVGKHSKTAEQLQTENINFPDSIEELQILLLRMREDLITAKVAHQHSDETLRSDILFLKDQLLAEQQEKSNLEDTLTADIRHLHEKLESQTYKLRVELDARIKEKEALMQSQQAAYQQKIRDLETKLEEVNSVKLRQDTDILHLRGKVHTLQVDLENSEAVQRDFVKLSQSLQIELEKIRASEHEVRWQYEEDVDDCRNCRQPFTVTRRKHHCRHCGKIFCAECVSKTVASGPHQRPSRVCDVCHTILDRQATPYFSVEPPKTPD